ENDYVPGHRDGMSDATIQITKDSLRKFGDYLGHVPTIDDLTDASVRSFMEHRANGRKATTVNREARSILALWNWLWKQSRIPNKPNVPLIQETHSAAPVEMTPWRCEDMRRLLEESEAARGMV